MPCHSERSAVSASGGRNLIFLKSHAAARIPSCGIIKHGFGMIFTKNPAQTAETFRYLWNPALVYRATHASSLRDFVQQT